MYAVINTSLQSLTNSLGILTISSATWIGLLLVVFPLKPKMVLSQIARAMSISWTVTGQSIIFWLLTIHLKYLTDVYPSLAYIIVFALHR